MTYVSSRDCAKKKEKYWSDPDAARARGRQRYAENREKIKAQVRAYRARNPEKVKATLKRYREENRDKCVALDKARYDRKRSELLEQKRRYYRSNIGIMRQRNSEFSKRYYREHKEKWIARSEKIKALPPEEKLRRHRQYMLRHKYDMTPEQYDSLLASQGGNCAICGDPPKVGQNKRLHVDHDHATGKVRGLLCMHCNHSIERVEKIPGWAAKTEAYLARPR
jgi:hypothetical protein